MAQEHLIRWPTTTGDRRTFTWSGWVKVLMDPNTRQTLWSADDNNGHASLQWDGRKLYWNTLTEGNAISYETFRDLVGWSHIVFAHDSINPNLQHRVRMWANGAALTMTDTGLNLAQGDRNVGTNVENAPNLIGAQSNSTQTGGSDKWLEGYMMDVYIVDGISLEPTDFGYFREGKGAQNLIQKDVGVEDDGNAAFSNGSWYPLPPQTAIANVNRQGGFGPNGCYLPMNTGFAPGLDFKETPDTILKLNTHEQQPRGGVRDGKIEVREDPLKDYLVLAAPGITGGLQGGYGDYSHIIRGSGSPLTYFNVNSTGASLSLQGEVDDKPYAGFFHGDSVYFDNSGDDRLAWNIDPIGTQDFTAECWIRRAKGTGFTATRSEGIITLGTVNDVGSTTLFIEGEYFILRTDNGSSWSNAYIESGRPYDKWMPPGQWTHVAVSRSTSVDDTSKGDIYIHINGEIKVYLKDFTMRSQTGAYIAFGAINSSASYPFQGHIADMRLYVGKAKYRDGGFNCPNIWSPCQGTSDWSDGETWRVTADTPANNYAHFNDGIGKGVTAGDQTPDDREGNLHCMWRNQSSSISSLGAPTGSGRWYAEFYLANNAYCPYIGVVGINRSVHNFEGYYNNAGWAGIQLGHSSNTANSRRKPFTGGATVGGTGAPPAWTGSGQIVGFELDTDNGTLKCYVDNTWYYTATDLPRIGGLTTNQNCPDYLHFVVFRTNDGATPVGSDWGEVWANFGQNPTFTGNKTKGTYTDASGHGLFYYKPPAGCKALCTRNLPEPAVPVPNKAFIAKTYSGTSTNRKVTIGFQPDLIWLKPTNKVDFWIHWNSVSGPGAALYGNGTNAEWTSSSNSHHIKGFDRDGWTLGGGWNNVNDTSYDYISYNWKAGGNKDYFNYNDVGYRTKSLFKANTGIDIGRTDRSTILGCSIGTKYGLSIIRFTGTAGNIDLTHGLGAEPWFILIKRASSAGNSWAVYHKYVGSGKQLLLNSDNGVSNDANGFNAQPDTDVVHLGSGASMATNQSGTNMMYAWSQIEGFSRFAFYYGNGSGDGPFLYCGFRPAMVIVKRADATSGKWVLWDTTRNPDSKGDLEMNLDAVDKEYSSSGNEISISATGFKITSSNARTNASGGYYIFCAWAECPTKYATSIR